MDNIVYFRKGTILANDSGVVFLVGDLAEEIFDEIRKAFTIDDVFYFEGKEIIVFGGTEALSMLQSMKEALFHYYRHDPAKLGRVMIASYEDAARLMKDFIYTFYDDLKMVFTTNPLVTAPLTTFENVVKVPSDLVDFPLEGIEQVMMLKGQGYLMLEQRRIDLMVGDVVYIPRGAAHYFTNTAREPTVAFVTYSPPFDGKDIVPVNNP